jgi:dihydrofolate reductase
MALIASFLVGANGATSLAGKSSPLSTASDRERFLKRHRSAGAFIIGKKSAAIEDYSRSQVPIFVLSRKSELLTFSHPLMQQVTVNRGDLAEITRRIDQRITGDVVVEAGASLLTALIEAGAIELLELTISPLQGDGDFVELDQLLRHFECSEILKADGTRLLQGRYKSDSTHG